MFKTIIAIIITVQLGVFALAGLTQASSNNQGLLIARNLKDSFKVDDTRVCGNPNDALDCTAVGANYNIKTIENGGTSLESIIGTIIAAILSLIGVIFIFFIVYGGYIWLEANGNEEEIKKAQNIIKDNVIGLIVVLSAYAISYFVISAFTSSSTGILQ